MKKETITKILQETQAISIIKKDSIQSLWSGYGEIFRCYLAGGNHSSVVVKHVDLTAVNDHPRGWNTDVSHQRKVHSYEVERTWYETLAKNTNDDCRIPKLIASWEEKGEVFMLMEDLNVLGFPVRKSDVNIIEIKACLKWLAYFHSQYLKIEPIGLWEVGTYWHLDSRPEEWKVMQNQPLKAVASAIDQKLNQCKYKTVVHGDAKIANFCFSNDGQLVSAVDFQYIGGGCGMKDVAYLISSCLDESDSETHEEELLEYYFNTLKTSLINTGKKSIYQEVIDEWLSLYKYAWADFFRFLDGWSPGHYKMHDYSRRLTQEVLDELKSNNR
ncbi:MAG: ecdysteroid 22-kinase family protein [Reichenbachiella sp.]